MFTSRAEYRLQLREDNADARLTPRGRELGLVDDARWAAFGAKAEAVEAERARLGALWASPNSALGRELAEHAGLALTRECNVLELMKRPEVSYAALMAAPALGPGVADARVAEQVEIGVRYSGYLERQLEDIERQRRHEDERIPADFEFAGIPGLSAELQGKLGAVRPETIGQAQRIPGMTPAAVSLLLVQLARRRRVA
jgi:tRNA uridine 5-carboxymethylaminomethyl modification enzyme